MYQNFIIPYLYEAQYVSGDTPPIIRSLKLHWQPLAFHTSKVVGRVVCGHCQAQYEKVQCTFSYCALGRHTAHHQELKTALATSGFSYVEGCWTCSWWTLSGTV